MTDNGSSPEYQFIYPRTVIHTFYSSSPAQDDLMQLQSYAVFPLAVTEVLLLEKEGLLENWDEAPCYTPLRSTCSSCYGGLGKLTVDREWEHKDNSIIAVYMQRWKGDFNQLNTPTVAMKIKILFSSLASATGGSNIFLQAPVLNILSAFFHEVEYHGP